MAFFTNSFVIALGIPLTIILCGAITKKISRKGGWQRRDFYLGRELTLTTIATALVYLSDLSKNATNNIIPTSELLPKIIGTATFVPISLTFLLFVLSCHQDYEKRTLNTMGQLVWLGVISNFIGVGLFAAFIIFIKGT